MLIIVLRSSMSPLPLLHLFNQKLRQGLAAICDTYQRTLNFAQHVECFPMLYNVGFYHVCRGKILALGLACVKLRQDCSSRTWWNFLAPDATHVPKI